MRSENRFAQAPGESELGQIMQSREGDAISVTVATREAVPLSVEYHRRSRS